MDAILQFAEDWYFVSTIVGGICLAITIVGGFLFVKSLELIKDSFNEDDEPDDS